MAGLTPSATFILTPMFTHFGSIFEIRLRAMLSDKRGHARPYHLFSVVQDELTAKFGALPPSIVVRTLPMELL